MKRALTNRNNRKTQTSIPLQEQIFDPSLKVCGISSADELSQSFNGLNHINKFSDVGITYNLLSDIHMRKNGKSITPKIFMGLKRGIAKIEKKSGFQSRIYFWTRFLRFRNEFKNADVIHYHILHNEFFRLESLRYLTRIKKSIWTFHDLWIATGHCIQPLTCERYGKGCGSCPDLKRTLAVRRDRTKKELIRKKKLISKIECEYIVSTNWMRKKILSVLPIDSDRLHVVPFGIDTDFFNPISQQMQNRLRDEYSLGKDFTYVFINAHNDYIKGIDIVEKLVVAMSLNDKVRFILIDDSKKFIFSSNVISFPRSHKPQFVRSLILLSDIVVIPSRGESFSILAVESMSCGKPVITSKFSAPHEVTQSSYEYTFYLENSTSDLISVIHSLSESRVKQSIEGRRNRIRAVKFFSNDVYVENLSTIYRKIGNRNNNE